MPLTPVTDMMKHSIQHSYAVGYFESWNLESLHAVLDAAEASRSPVIIGFNGEFLARPERRLPERLALYAALGSAAAASTTVPCGLIFNECPSDVWVRRAIDAGFNLVMPVPDTGESYSAYSIRVASLVAYAQQKGVAVEAEVDTLPYGAEDAVSNRQMTDPTRAAAFAQQTHIDLLAISVGNIHVLLQGQKPLDVDRVQAIQQATSLPLVLHGGSGIDGTTLKEAIAAGVAKVNYGTVLKQRYLESVRLATTNSDPNPHHLLGYGGYDDVMTAGRIAVCDAVLEKMELLGCVGKADLYALCRLCGYSGSGCVLWASGRTA